MSAYDCKVLDCNGIEFPLSKYRGHVILIVNTSCFDEKAAKSYELLASIYDKYKDEDLSILLFPCSQFGSKTSSMKEKEFLTTSNLSQAGTIFKEIDVNGPATTDLYKFLKSAKRGNSGGFIKCNFTIFVVDRQGMVAERLNSNVNPYVLDEILVKYF